MITSEGYFGVAPCAAQQNDILFLFAGCSTPMIVRPVEVEKCFLLVGECYVEGMMDGEGLGSVWFPRVYKY
jgi:hypothetical protein